MHFTQALVRPNLRLCFLGVVLAATSAWAQQPITPPEQSPSNPNTTQQSSPPKQTTQEPQPTPAPGAASAPTDRAEVQHGRGLVPRAWNILRAGARDENKDQRAAAVRVLGLIPRDTRSRRTAERALSDKEAEVRAAAAAALGKMGAKTSRARLRRALNDKDSEVVLAAASSLRMLGDRDAYRVYYAVLTGKMKSGQGLLEEQQEMLKDPKKMALFGFEQGIGYIPFAGIGYRAFKVLTKDDSSPVRAAAAKVLAQDPDPRSREALVEAATTDDSWIVRAAALDALAHRGDGSVLPKIAPALSDDKDEVRFTAAATIIRLSQAERKPKRTPPNQR
ncbi:MAG TPA: HEAT repeat domain-containing protein [Terriglobales bacterium]|nr:HEAT repeat domain-containing protein [Terriglobales bacterium]